MRAVCGLAEAEVSVGEDTVVTRARIDPGDEVFAGHYPGFPILPGVLLVDAVRSAAARYGEAHGFGRLRLVEVRSARFLAPVFPGDELTTDCAVSRTGDLLEVRATCSTGRGRAARITLRCAPDTVHTRQTAAAGDGRGRSAG